MEPLDVMMIAHVAAKIIMILNVKNVSLVTRNLLMGNVV